MGIDVSAAHIQAGQLKQYEYWLDSAIQKMNTYKSRINANWQGPEVAPVNIAIDQVIASLRNEIRELDALSNDVINTANAIRAEEIEAERQRNLAEANRQKTALSKELKDLDKQKKELEKSLEKDKDNKDLKKKIKQLKEKIEKTKQNYDSWVRRYNSLVR